MARLPASGDVLVIKLGALGDVVLSLPHIAKIAEAVAPSRVTLLTAPDYRELAELVPGIEVVAFPRRGFMAMLRLLRWLLPRRFRVVFDLQGSTRSRLVTLLTQAEVRVGRQAGMACTHVPPGREEPRHAFECLNDLLAAAGVAPASAAPLPLTVMPSVPRVRAWLDRQLPAGRRPVLLHAGSARRWPSKRWEAPHFIELARQLEARGFAVIWIGGAQDREVNRRLAGAAGIDAAGAFSCVELIALGRHAAFAVTGDSGPMHLLSLAGIPVYAFFGPTDWRRSHAMGQQPRVLLNPVPCSPCHRGVCPPRHRHECLAGITPASVIARLQADKLIQGTSD